MDLLKNKKKLNIILFAFLIITLFVSFHKILSLDTITNYDDKFLLGGVEKIQNVKDYINLFNSGKILDLQPVRDLSYFADFKIKSIIPSYPFHLTNLILWIFIC